MKSKTLAVVTGLMLLTMAYGQQGFAQKSDQEEVARGIAVNRQPEFVQRQSSQETDSARPVKQSPAPAGTREITLGIDGSPFLGDERAKLTVIEFSDYQ